MKFITYIFSVFIVLTTSYFVHSQSQNTKIRIDKKDIRCFRGGGGEIVVSIIDQSQSFEFQLVNSDNNTIIYDWKSAEQGNSSKIVYAVQKGRFEIRSRDKINPANPNIDKVEILEPEELKILETKVITKPSFNQSDGVLRIKISGGVTPYKLTILKKDNTYQEIPNFQGDITGLAKGNFIFQITDAAGCGPLPGSVVVNEQESYTIESSIESVACSANSFLGRGLIKFSGGSPPYLIQWEGNQKSFSTDQNFTIEFKERKIYNVKFSDQSARSYDIPFDFTKIACALKVSGKVTKVPTATIIEGGEVELSTDGVLPFSCEVIDSKANSLVSGRTGIQTNSFTFGALKAGSYVFKVKDSNGAEGSSGTIIINQPFTNSNDARGDFIQSMKEFYELYDRIKLKKSRKENGKKFIGYSTTALSLAGAYLSAGASQIASLVIGFAGQVYSQEDGGENGNLAKCEKALSEADALVATSLNSIITDPFYFEDWDMNTQKRKDFGIILGKLKTLMISGGKFASAPKVNISIEKLRKKFSHEKAYSY